MRTDSLLLSENHNSSNSCSNNTWNSDHFQSFEESSNTFRPVDCFSAFNSTSSISWLLLIQISNKSMLDSIKWVQENAYKQMDNSIEQVLRRFARFFVIFKENLFTLIHQSHVEEFVGHESS